MIFVTRISHLNERRASRNLSW